MIFLDSSYLVAVAVESDQNHPKAIRLNREIAKGEFGKAVISDYIFDETITVIFGRTKDIDKAVQVGTNLFASAEVINVGDKRFMEAWNLFKVQRSTRLSFTDCTTLSIMRERAIPNVATFDEDFKKVKWVKVA